MKIYRLVLEDENGSEVFEVQGTDSKEMLIRALKRFHEDSIGFENEDVVEVWKSNI